MTGTFISDNGDIRDLHSDERVAETLGDAAHLALEAGVDQEMQIGAPWERRTNGLPFLKG